MGKNVDVKDSENSAFQMIAAVATAALTGGTPSGVRAEPPALNGAPAVTQDRLERSENLLSRTRNLQSLAFLLSVSADDSGLEQSMTEAGLRLRGEELELLSDVLRKVSPKSMYSTTVYRLPKGTNGPAVMECNLPPTFRTTGSSELGGVSECSLSNIVTRSSRLPSGTNSLGGVSECSLDWTIGRTGRKGSTALGGVAECNMSNVVERRAKNGLPDLYEFVFPDSEKATPDRKFIEANKADALLRLLDDPSEKNSETVIRTLDLTPTRSAERSISSLFSSIKELADKFGRIASVRKVNIGADGVGRVVAECNLVLPTKSPLGPRVRITLEDRVETFNLPDPKK